MQLRSKPSNPTRINDRSLQKAQNQMMVMMMPSPALNAPASHGLAVMCLEHPQ